MPRELSFAQFVYLLRNVCLFFTFWMIKCTIMFCLMHLYVLLFKNWKINTLFSKIIQTKAKSSHFDKTRGYKNQKFPTRVPNLELSGSKLQLWILSHFDTYTSFYSILTLIGWEKQLHSHHTQIFAPAGIGMCKILHIHTFKTLCNAATSLCTFAVKQSNFQWFTWLARINILIRGRVGQGQDLKSHIN